MQCSRAVALRAALNLLISNLRSFMVRSIVVPVLRSRTVSEIEERRTGAELAQKLWCFLVSHECDVHVTCIATIQPSPIVDLEAAVMQRREVEKC